MKTINFNETIKKDIKALVIAWGSEKKKEKKPNRPKSEGSWLLPVPIYVFDDSEQ